MEEDFNERQELLGVSRRGQASIEYLAVFGIALAISTPFIMNAQSSLLDLRTGSGSIEAQNSLQKIETAVNTVAASGEPAQRTFTVRLPQNYEGGEVRDNAIAFTMRNRAGESDFIRTFDVDLNGDVPQTPGRYEVTVYMGDGNATIEVVG